jgi:hypothetical protein
VAAPRPSERRVGVGGWVCCFGTIGTVARGRSADGQKPIGLFGDTEYDPAYVMFWLGLAAAGVNHWEPPVKVNRFSNQTGTIDVSDEVPEAGGQDVAIGGDSVWFLKDGDVLRIRLSP